MQEVVKLRAVLLDRDGTLVHNVPYNGDPDQVTIIPGADRAVARLREAGIATALITNQSGIGRGLITRAQVDAVNARVGQLLGPLDSVVVCEHRPDDACACRKPAPGLVLQAAAALRVPPEQCAVIGDRGSDVEAALAAGARGVLVPSPATTAQEVADAPEVAHSLAQALDLLLGAASRR